MESKILFEAGKFFVIKAKKGFEVYEAGLTHATRCAIIGYTGEVGLGRAIAEAKRRHTQELQCKPSS